MLEVEGRGGERATIQAVAARAGVSVTTVSLVLSGKGGTRRISESTHQRVQKAAEELNYAPNLGTRTIRGDRTNILSFFSTYRNRDRNDLYMNSLSSAVEAAGGAEGYDILVHCNFNRDPKQIYQFLNGGLADGLLLFAPLPDDPLLQLLRKSRLPVVIMNSRDAEGQYSSVVDDVEQGMRLLADAIVAEGHRNVAALVSETAETPDCWVRIELLTKRLRDLGVDLPPHRLIPTGEGGVDRVVSAFNQESEPPTAIYCWHDRLAYAFLSACEQQGVSIPDRWSVVGYDGLHWPSRSSHEVSSIKIDFDELASTAVKLLDRSIQNPNASAVHETLAVSYLRGTSLGPAPRS